MASEPEEESIGGFASGYQHRGFQELMDFVWREPCVRKQPLALSTPLFIFKLFGMSRLRRLEVVEPVCDKPFVTTPPLAGGVPLQNRQQHRN